MDLLPPKTQSWGWGMQKDADAGETVSEVIKQDTREQGDIVKASDPPPPADLFVLGGGGNMQN